MGGKGKTRQWEKEEIVGFLTHTVRMERDTLTLQRVYDALQSKGYNLCSRRHYEKPVFEMPSLLGFGLNFLGYPVVCMLLGYAIGFFGSAPFLYRSSADLLTECMMNGTTLSYIGMAVGAVLAMVKFLVRYLMAQKRYEQQLQEYTNNVSSAEKQFACEVQIKPHMERGCTEAAAALQETRVLMQALYAKEGLQKKYQNLVAVCSLLTYAKVGKFEGFTGETGLYAKYEKDAQECIITTDLAEAMQMAAALEATQECLFLALQSSKQTVKDIKDGFVLPQTDEKPPEENIALQLFFENVRKENKETRAYLQPQNESVSASAI